MRTRMLRPVLLLAITLIAFSIASAPSESEFLELHVRHVSGGGFTGHVFSDMKPGEILRLEGPCRAAKLPLALEHTRRQTGPQARHVSPACRV